MGWKATNAILGLDVGKVSKKCILFALAARADDNFECYPSLPRIAAEANLTKSAVSRLIGELVTQGVLEKRTRYDEKGSQTSNGYKIVMSAPVSEDEPTEDEAPEEVAPVTQQATPPLLDEQPPVTQQATPRYSLSNAPLLDKQPNQSLNRSVEPVNGNNTGTQEGDRSAQDEKREKLNTDTDTVLTQLNADCGKQYRITDKTARSLVMRLMGNDGYTLEDLLMVIESKAAQWLDDDRTEQWLKPSTLFGPKFGEYHAEALASRAKREAQQKGRQDLNELARRQAEEEERRNAEFMATPVPAADMLGPIQWRAMKVDGLTFELFNRIMEAVPKDEKRLRNDWKRFVQEGLARLLAEPMTAGEARGARVKDVLHRLDSSRQAAALMALAGRDASETKTLTEWRAIAAGNNMERQTA